MPAAGHPDGEPVDVVVSAVGILRAGGPAEFAGEEDDRRVEQAALLEVLEEPGDGPVDRP